MLNNHLHPGYYHLYPVHPVKNFVCVCLCLSRLSLQAAADGSVARTFFPQACRLLMLNFLQPARSSRSQPVSDRPASLLVRHRRCHALCAMRYALCVTFLTVTLTAVSILPQTGSMCSKSNGSRVSKLVPLPLAMGCPLAQCPAVAAIPTVWGC